MTRDWIEINTWLLEQVKGLPYKPGLRWCFYRVLEKFMLSKDDWVKFKTSNARLRKGQRHGWKPDYLSDTVRYPIYNGFGPASWKGFREKMISAAPNEGVWTPYEQKKYIEVWYEAEAMTGQFNEYVAKPYRISLRPFRGDYTIGPKWDTAQHLRMMVGAGSEATIIYFGDADTKGAQIPLSALKDVRRWSGVDFDFIVGGLTVDQAEELELQENFERPGQYQWEALSDPQARKLIMQVIEENVDLPELTIAIEAADKKRADWLERATDALNEIEAED